MSERIGVLALQGDFAEHLAVLERLAVEAAEVRTREQVEDATALVIPGGESTTMIKLIDRFDLRDLIKKRIGDGMPVMGTCAGAIVLAREVSDGEKPLGELDIVVRRNAYGRQVESFEAEVRVEELGKEPIKGVFIRAPVLEELGARVRILGTWADRPVIVRQDNLLATTFHPELTDDDRVHRYFLEQICGAG